MEDEKVDKYQDLAKKIRKMWNVQTNAVFILGQNMLYLITNETCFTINSFQLSVDSNSMIALVLHCYAL